MISSECKFGNNSSEASNITRCFLESMFALLNERQMQYVVLRNYEDLPDVVDNDVDLLVASGNMKQVEAELAILARQSGFLLLRKVRRFRYVSFWYLLPGEPQVLHLDIWTAIDIKGICWLAEKEILARRKPYKQFFVPQDYSLALMLLLKDILQTGKFREKYKNQISQILNGDYDNFRASLELLTGKSLARQILAAITSDQWNNLNILARKVQFQIILRAIIKRPINSFCGLAGFLAGHVKAIFGRSSGFFLVLVGPDGSGKSSVYTELCSQLSSLFKSCSYYHGRFNIIPDLKDLVRGRLRTSSTAPDFALRENSDAGRVYSFLRAMLYIKYYSLDYLFGHRTVCKAAKNGGLIVFDRYFYDYMIQPAFRRVPLNILNFFAIFLPRPDMVVYLKCDPQVIHLRKPELTVSEIISQQQRIEQVFASHARLIILDTAGPVDQAVARLRDAVFTQMHRRCQP